MFFWESFTFEYIYGHLAYVPHLMAISCFLQMQENTPKKDSFSFWRRSRAPSLGGHGALHVPIPGRPVGFFDSVDDNPVNAARETLGHMAGHNLAVNTLRHMSAPQVIPQIPQKRLFLTHCHQLKNSLFRRQAKAQLYNE